MTINRRRTLGGLAIGPALGAAPVRAQSSAVFLHGVACGDPAPDGFVIWTRVSHNGAATAEVPVQWEVAADPAFARIIRRGQAVARAARDHTVKVEVAGLKPGVTYHYRFRSGGGVSPAGRARTLPTGPLDELVIAHACCAMYAGGYFNAYQAMAGLPRLDVVLHLGDYIYENAGQAPADYGYDTGLALGRLPDPRHACVSLDDYRRRFAQSRRDAQLQAAHARAAWICTWDDHDSANDAFTDGAQAHSDATDGPWSARKAAAVQAFYEWMPVRDPAPDAGFAALNKSFDFGDLASLTVLETRLNARDRQLTFGGDLTKLPDGSPDVAGFLRKLTDPTRRMMSQAQEAWLAARLNASVRAQRPWQLIGSAVTLARACAPDLKFVMGPEPYAAMAAKVGGYYGTALKALDANTRYDLPFALDSWDGYPAARARLYDIVRRSGARCVALSGDSHLSWVNDLHDDDGRRIAAEFGATALTSGGWGDSLPPGTPLGSAFVERNAEVVFVEAFHKGFMLSTVTRDAVTCAVIGVSTVASRDFETRVLKTFRVTHEGQTVSAPVEV